MLKSTPSPYENQYGPDRKQHGLREDPPKGKGKGKRKKGSGSGMAPRGTIGCVRCDPKDRNLCFDYNLSSCTNAPGGGACAKGRHVCFKAGCQKVHQVCKAHPADMP